MQEDVICQCCTCEQVFIESELVNRSCPHCYSGNWVIGYIDDPDSDNFVTD